MLYSALLSYVFRNVIWILSRSVIRLASRNTHSVVRLVQTLFFSLSLSRATLLQKGISYAKCRANIKGITTTLLAIRANENFGPPRRVDVAWVFLEQP